MLQQPKSRNFFESLYRYLTVWIWHIDTEKMPAYRRLPLHILRLMVLSVRGFHKDKCSLNSSALTFYSALALVPSIVIAFGISRSFGLNVKDIKAEISTLLRGQEAIVEQLFVYADNMLSRTRGDLIAGVGLLLLFYTVMRLLHNAEDIFNGIWDIRKHRSPQRKFADYTAILLVSPMLIFFSSSLNVFLTTQLKTFLADWGLISYFASLLTLFARFIPLLLLWVLLGLFYLIMPNTRVKVRSAVIAAVVAGTAFQLVQWMYIKFQVGVSSYNAIYGSLAALPLFLIWLQISWMIALYGAELAFAHQNVKNYAYMNDRPLSLREKKYVALLVMAQLSNAFRAGESATLSSIARSARVPRGLVVESLADLQAARLVHEIVTEKYESRYQPALDIHRLTPRLIIDRLETTGFTGMAMNHQNERALRLRSVLSSGREQHMDTRILDM